MFRNFFSKKPAALTGAPPVRRMKTYSAQSGYVYQYYYEGYRPFRSAGESGSEFVFTISLFQAFDDRSNPGLMRDAVRVRPADVEAIVETLDL